jgi:hypothetical protein
MDADPELQHVMDGELKLVRPGIRGSARRLDRLLHPGFSNSALRAQVEP